MVADRGLTAIQRLSEVTSADFTLGNAGDQAEKTKSNRVGEGLEVAGQCLSFPHRERLVGHRYATVGIHVHQRQANTLTAIDMMA